MKLRKKRIGDPEGIMATLQIAKRLLSERNDKGIYPALDEALEMSAAKDRARAWWAAHRAIVDALPDGFSTIGDYTMLSGTTVEDCEELLARAILAQGSANLAQTKAGAK